MHPLGQNLVRQPLLPVLVLCLGGLSLTAQEDPVRTLERLPLFKSDYERDRALRLGFEAALTRNIEAARPYLPLVIDRPWLEEVDFRGACALARAASTEPVGEHQTKEAALADRLVLAAGLHNPALALRETGQYLPLPGGSRLFEQFVLAAPDQAMGLASGDSREARTFRERMAGSRVPELALLVRLADDTSIDLPRRSRLAIMAGRIASGKLSFDAALRIAGSTPQFFAVVLDMRTNAALAEAGPLERALESESLVLCQAAQQNLDLILASELAHFRAVDLYILLALGRAEATPRVFAAVFDRLLVSKWKAGASKGDSLVAWLDRTKDWELRDFAAAALRANRFDKLLSVAGPDVISRLARGIDRAGDPLKDAVRLAEIIDASSSPALLEQMASIVFGEFVRCRDAGDLRGTTLYGLLGAKLSVSAIAAPYLPFLKSTEMLDTALLLGRENDCIERYFFYDDEDGVESFESFRRSYQNDPAWQMEDRGKYVRLTGHGREGRRIEIFANVPIDGHLPRNRPLEGEAERRQRLITAELDERGLVPTVIVHRGHSFWVERTLTYLAKTTRLVILGSCGGDTEIHAVIEASPDAQVIATRGIGETEINDAIMKAVNVRILEGERMIPWNSFWQEFTSRRGKSALLREYMSPNQDPGMNFLQAYHRFVDASN